MERKTVKITFIEPVLGTSPSNTEIAAEYIASKAPTMERMDEEVAAISIEEMVNKSKTVFPRNENGDPILWDYQIKGFLKDTVGMLRKVSGTASSKVKAYKKEIDGLIFAEPRKIPIKFDGEIGSCQRPLRAQTMKGERVSLANSEEIPAGATIEVTFAYYNAAHWDLIEECLNYGVLRGIGQWRNSGKGRFVWAEV